MFLGRCRVQLSGKSGSLLLLGLLAKRCYFISLGIQWFGMAFIRECLPSECFCLFFSPFVVCLLNFIRSIVCFCFVGIYIVRLLLGLYVSRTNSLSADISRVMAILKQLLALKRQCRHKENVTRNKNIKQRKAPIRYDILMHFFRLD